MYAIRSYYGPLSILIGIWRGEEAIHEKIAEGLLVIDGPADLVQTVDNWFPLSPVVTTQSPDSTPTEGRSYNFV